MKAMLCEKCAEGHKVLKVVLTPARCDCCETLKTEGRMYIVNVNKFPPDRSAGRG